MSYRSPTLPAHRSIEPVGVLLTNVGSPDAPTGAALRPYLAQFLGDDRVIEYSNLYWKPLLHGVILNTRPWRSARLYERIWSEDGSPLLAILRRQAAALQAELADQLPDTPLVVAYGLRYGEPSIAAGLRELERANVRRVLVIPLFPHYSATTTATSLDAVFDELKSWRWVPELRTVNHYHDHPLYIQAIAASIRAQWAKTGTPERLLMSFHGIPRDYFLKGDPYYCECQKSARLVAEALKLPDGMWAATFQSRFGPTEWLQPYTDKTLEAWGAEGLRHVDAICPGFSADCLETVDEIGHEGRLSFQEAGGGTLNYIPALNDHPDHIALLASLATTYLGGWLEPPPLALPTSPELAVHRAALGLDSTDETPDVLSGIEKEQYEPAN